MDVACNPKDRVIIRTCPAKYVGTDVFSMYNEWLLIGEKLTLEQIDHLPNPWIEAIWELKKIMSQVENKASADRLEKARRR